MIDTVPSFYWNGKDSYEDFGIVINTLPPETIPEDDITEITVIGRDGDLTIDNNAKKTYTIPIACTLLDSDRIDEVKAWLSGGAGDLICNWQSEFKYEARLNNKLDISQSLEICGEFQVIWKVQPYKKSIADDLITLNASGTIYNPTGNVSNPIIKLYGEGIITLTINDNTINLTNINGYVTINSDLMDCYRDTQLYNNYMVGEFPTLEVGNNAISWTGSVTKVEITPNWRYI